MFLRLSLGLGLASTASILTTPQRLFTIRSLRFLLFMVVALVLLFLVVIFDWLLIFLVICVSNQLVLHCTQIVLLVNWFGPLLPELVVLARPNVGPLVHLKLDEAIVELGVCI